MSLQIITLIVAVIVAWLLLGLVLKVIKTSLRTAIILVLIFLALQFWGIKLPDIGEPISQVWQTLVEFFNNLIRMLPIRLPPLGSEGVGFAFDIFTLIGN